MSNLFEKGFQHVGAESLLQQVLRIEKLDTRGRKIDASVNAWINQMEDDKLGFGSVQVFNWLAGVTVQKNGPEAVLYTPSLGGGADEQVFARWLERFFYSLMRSYRVAKITINGLEGYQYPNKKKGENNA